MQYGAEKLTEYLELLQGGEYLVKSSVGKCLGGLSEQHKCAITALLESVRDTQVFTNVKDIHEQKVVKESPTANDEKGKSVVCHGRCSDVNCRPAVQDFTTVLLLMWPYGECQGTNGQIMNAAVEETLTKGSQVCCKLNHPQRLMIVWTILCFRVLLRCCLFLYFGPICIPRAL